MQEKIVVAYVCDKDYLPYLKKSIESVKRYNKNVEFCVITTDNIKLPDVQTYTIVPDNSRFKFKRNDRMNEAVYYKFYLPILPYDKVLYLDCDTICQRPLDELWNQKCDFICATESYCVGKRQALDLGVDTYYLTGMMLMNLNALREEHFTDRCLDRVFKESALAQHDESIINLEFGNKITNISTKFNYCHNRRYIENVIPESDAFILHFVGRKHEKEQMLKRINFESLDKLKLLLDNKTVAIVGNSEKIFDKKNGSKIDEHDIIIRFNRGIPKNIESQGTRTDILFIACTLTPEELNQFNAKYTVRRSIFSGNKCDFELKVEERKQFEQIPNEETKRRKIATSQASTGYLAIQFALSTNCKSIDLYGFDFLENPTYYNAPTYKPLHNGEKEKEKVLEYQKYGLVNIK